MSVSKNWDINLRLSERKTLSGFLALYLFLCIGILLLLGIGYFQIQKNNMLQSKREMLNSYANKQVKELKQAHINIDKSKVYPRNPNFISGIFDSSKKTIFSLLKLRPNLSKVIYEEDKRIYYVKELESYYLGAKYLVLSIKDNRFWLKEVYGKFIWFGIPLLGLFLIFGYFLLRLFLRPMREAISLLDRFIKDTTHELNTPISAILSNVEMIDNKKFDEKTQVKLRRIDIGARTVSNLYQDLVYLTLGHKVSSRDEDISMKDLMVERLEYFSLNIQSKNLKLEKSLKEANLFIDKTKITKLADNLYQMHVNITEKMVNFKLL